MKQNKDKEFGKGVIVGTLMAAAIGGLMKLMDRYFGKKQNQNQPEE